MDLASQFHTVRGYQLLMQNKKHLTPAMEDYLEMIYRNSLVEGYMRISTLSELLNVQAPSATRMVQKLTSLGMLDYKRYGIIFLTDTGKDIGKFLLERHNIIETFLKNLEVGETILQDTELMEHNISTDTLHRLLVLNLFFEEYPEFKSLFSQYLIQKSEP